MDNGISLKDLKLKNILIDCDVQDTFLQMLGRKRVQDEKVNIYLVNKTREQISWRYRKNADLAEVCIEYLGDENYVKGRIWNICKGNDRFCIENEERSFLWSEHNKMLKKLLYDKDERIQQLFNVQDGYLRFNHLAAKRVDYLKNYYKELLDAMKLDEDALMIRELSWLGIDEELSKQIVKRDRASKYEKSWEEVNRAFAEKVGKVMTKEEFIELKIEIKSSLHILVNTKDSMDAEGKRLSSNIKKIDRPLSADGIEWLQVNCGLMYQLETIKQKKSNEKIEETRYIITAVDIKN